MQFEGFELLTNSKPIKLFPISKSTLLNMKLCGSVCRETKNCYAFSFDNKANECQVFAKLGEFSPKPAIKLDHSVMYLVKQGEAIRTVKVAIFVLFIL